MSASVFSADEEDVLHSLGCWKTFSTVPKTVLGNVPRNDGCNEDNNNEDDREATKNGDGDGEGEAGGEAGINTDQEPTGNNNGNDEADTQNNGGEGASDEGSAEEAGRLAHGRSKLEREMRRRAAEAVLAWLRSIESCLTERCADVCDAAWYDLGETITYKGRPVAYDIPEAVMEAATRRREDAEDREIRRSR